MNSARDTVCRSRRTWILGVLSTFLTAACEDSSSKSADAMRKRLVGRWLEEMVLDGVQTRSIVVLDIDGYFTEVENTLQTDGTTTRETHSGEWSFDGINFKRKYTALNGQSLSTAKLGYATYAISSSVKDEFRGLDNVRLKETHFIRTESVSP